MMSGDLFPLPITPTRTSVVRVFALVSFIAILLCGCSKRDGNLNVSANSKTFDTAPAELKAKWQMAAANTAKSDYLGAVTNLAFLFSKSDALNTEQLTALQQAWSDIGNQAFQAANNGDKTALEAVMAIRAFDAAKDKGVR